VSIGANRDARTASRRLAFQRKTRLSGSAWVLDAVTPDSMTVIQMTTINAAVDRVQLLRMPPSS
jgi:hypothetical protein